jgi:hypothetical protein
MVAAAAVDEAEEESAEDSANDRTGWKERTEVVGSKRDRATSLTRDSMLVVEWLRRIVVTHQDEDRGSE